MYESETIEGDGVNVGLHIFSLGATFGGFNGNNPGYHCPVTFRLCYDFMAAYHDTYEQNYNDYLASRPASESNPPFHSNIRPPATWSPLTFDAGDPNTTPTANANLDWQRVCKTSYLLLYDNQNDNGLTTNWHEPCGSSQWTTTGCIGNGDNAPCPYDCPTNGAIRSSQCPVEGGAGCLGRLGTLHDKSTSFVGDQRFFTGSSAATFGIEAQRGIWRVEAKIRSSFCCHVVFFSNN